MKITIVALLVLSIASGIVSLALMGGPDMTATYQGLIESLQKKEAAQDELIGAQRTLIAALKRQAEAAEHLADEREKSLVLYRAMTQACLAPSVTIPSSND